MSNTLLHIAIAILILVPTTRLSAQWSTDPAVNNVICNAANFEIEVVSASDGTGGAIFAWTDYRTPSEYCAFGAPPSEENIRFGTRPLHAGEDIATRCPYQRKSSHHCR